MYLNAVGIGFDAGAKKNLTDTYDVFKRGLEKITADLKPDLTDTYDVFKHHNYI